MSRSRKGSRKSGATRTRASLNGRDDQSLVEEDDVVEETNTQAVATATAQPVRRRRFTRKRILLSVLGVIVLILLGAAGWVYFSIQRTLPTINGTAQVKGLSGPVTVTRDNYGVPHIVAANVADLYAAQGYVHAQDRLAQMFLFRAYGEGRVAELGGSDDAIKTDRFLRTVGFKRAAEAELAAMAPEVRAGLEAYARGVNEFIHTHQDSLPLEFTLGGFKLEDWQPVDSVLFSKLQAWDLTASWEQDVLTSDLSALLGVTRTAQLLPNFPAEGPFIVPGASSGSLTPLLQLYNDHVKPYLPGMGLSELGSNNWVVSGKKSATGAPLLSNDPHLALRSPSPWYQVHLSTTDGKYDVVGFGFASAPGVVTGHNKNIAWGVTNTEADVQDLFIEKLDPVGHPNQYTVGDKWEPLQLVTETIKVKGGESVTQTVRLTRHGPIMNDTTNDTSTLTSTVGISVTEPVALQWSAAKPGRLLESVYAMQTASNWQEFRAALSKWDVPGQNFVYADKQGNIGYQMTGRVPLRKKGDGSMPVPGWTGEYEWDGYIPFDELPRAYNPPEGYIATANNRPFGPDYKYQMHGGWAPPWRIDRIVEMLKAKDKLGVDDFKAMLMDTKSPIAKKFGGMLANLKPTGDKEKQIVAMFAGWDGDLKADSVTAAAYEFTIRSAISETFRDDLDTALFGEYVVVGGNSTQRALENLLDKPDDPFWDRAVTTATKELRDDILLQSLSNAVSELNGGLGDNVSDWTWGKVHTVSPPHPFAEAPMVGGIFTLPTLPMGGDGTTVSVAGFPLLRSYAVNHHQSYRMIIDVGDFSKSLGIFATGQSGQPFAKHWGDMLPLWQRYDYNPLLYTTQEVDAQKEGVLTLNP